MTMYIPGPMLRDGENELILLEVEESVEKPTGEAYSFLLLAFFHLVKSEDHLLFYGQLWMQKCAWVFCGVGQ